MSSALVLINRLRAKAREEQVTAFATSDDLHIALLSELNQAIRIVLEERTWNFQVRSDGTLKTKTGYVDTTQDVSVLGAIFTIPLSAATQSDLSGDFITSFQITGSPTHANTVFDFIGCSTDAVSSTTGRTSFAPPAVLGFEITEGFTLAHYQFALPATVRSILEIWHQEENIEIFQEHESDFRTLIPRPFEDYGSMPRVAFIGGTGNVTSSNTTSGTPTGAVRNLIKLWPIPGTEELLNYRYVYRQADLSAETDSVDGVPQTVEDLIIQLAYARQLQSIQADPTRGLQMEAAAMREIELKHRNNRMDPNRTRRLESLDDIGSRPNGLLRSYSTVPGWP
jgi:hypothetical protein